MKGNPEVSSKNILFLGLFLIVVSFLALTILNNSGNIPTYLYIVAPLPGILVMLYGGSRLGSGRKNNQLLIDKEIGNMRPIAVLKFSKSDAEWRPFTKSLVTLLLVGFIIYCIVNFQKFGNIIWAGVIIALLFLLMVWIFIPAMNKREMEKINWIKLAVFPNKLLVSQRIFLRAGLKISKSLISIGNIGNVDTANDMPIIELKDGTKLTLQEVNSSEFKKIQPKIKIK